MHNFRVDRESGFEISLSFGDIRAQDSNFCRITHTQNHANTNVGSVEQQRTDERSNESEANPFGELKNCRTLRFGKFCRMSD